MNKKQLEIGSSQPVEIIKFKNERRENMNLGDNLKKIRKDNNLSQEQLAEKLGVSRQSVSKWESGLAYPEMDKVLQICKMFNLNIDELFNQDIKEVNNSKQSKNNINKYIDDFLDYISKTVDLFGSLTFKQKIKCIFELCVISLFIFIAFLIIGSIGSILVGSILNFLPPRINFRIYSVISDLYIVVALITGIIILLHIFKVRYLDYYVIIDKPEVDNKKEEKIITDDNKEEKNKTEKVHLEKESKKIIIRDPEHSGYKFINGLLKCIIFVIKFFAIMIACFFAFTLVLLVVSLIVSFLFIKSGLLFVGLLFTFLSGIILNTIILIILYNFIVSQKIKKKLILLIIIISLLIAGLGIGLMSIGITSFDIVTDINSDVYVTDSKIIKMNDDLIINYHGGYLKYVEADNEDIKIEYRRSRMFDLYIENYEDNTTYLNLSVSNGMDSLRTVIADINNKKIVDYDNAEITIYTTKANIDKLKQNKKSYQDTENYYERIIGNLNEQIDELNDRVYELEDELYNY